MLIGESELIDMIIEFEGKDFALDNLETAALELAVYVRKYRKLRSPPDVAFMLQKIAEIDFHSKCVEVSFRDQMAKEKIYQHLDLLFKQYDHFIFNKHLKNRLEP